MALSMKQVLLPFDKLTEQNLKPLVKKFAHWNVNIASTDAPNKSKRESGMLIKDVTFTFEDGQKMLVRVKSGGTVFQVKLNNKVVPIRNVDDIEKAIIEMVDYVQDNAKAYERAKIQREKRRKLNITPPSVVTNRQEKIALAKTRLEETTLTNTDLEAQQSTLLTELADNQAELAKVQSELQAEKEKTVALENTLRDLQAAA